MWAPEGRPKWPTVGACMCLIGMEGPVRNFCEQAYNRLPTENLYGDLKGKNFCGPTPVFIVEVHSRLAHRKPILVSQRQKCHGPHVGTLSLGLCGISVGLPCPQSPTVHPQLLTVGRHGYVCWVNVMFYGSGKHSKHRVQHSLLGMGGVRYLVMNQI